MENNRPTCGYEGHVCCYRDGQVQFISRHRGIEDYCVGGQRVSVDDDGTIRNATPEQARAVENYLYARYIANLMLRNDGIRRN